MAVEEELRSAMNGARRALHRKKHEHLFLALDDLEAILETPGKKDAKDAQPDPVINPSD